MIDEEDKSFINKVKKLLPTEEDRMNMLCTLLGVSGVLAEHIIDDVLQNKKVKDLPVTVKYACALVSANMIALISDEKVKISNITPENYEMGEQTQERIYRTMKWVVEELYKSMQENENDN